jgi:hypothetical protein
LVDADKLKLRLFENGDSLIDSPVIYFSSGTGALETYDSQVSQNYSVEHLKQPWRDGIPRGMRPEFQNIVQLFIGHKIPPLISFLLSLTTRVIKRRRFQKCFLRTVDLFFFKSSNLK